jgi:hypothetical protein
VGGNGPGDVVAGELEQGLEALAFECVFGQGSAFEAEVGDLLAEVGVFAADVAEVEVVGPGVADAAACAGAGALKGREERQTPQAEEPDLRSVGRMRICGAADLDGERDGLQQQQRDEDQGVFEAGEEGFHEEVRVRWGVWSIIRVWAKCFERRVPGEGWRVGRADGYG